MFLNILAQISNRCSKMNIKSVDVCSVYRLVKPREEGIMRGGGGGGGVIGGEAPI